MASRFGLGKYGLRGRPAQIFGALLLVGVGVGQYLGIPTAGLRNGVVHVAPWGSDLFIGHAKEWPLRSLARAVVLADPGETILLWPGTYHETVLIRRGGLPGKPLRIRAAIPGQAVLSGAAPQLQGASWQWRSSEPSTYSTTSGSAISYVTLDGQAAFRSRSHIEFESLCQRPGAGPVFYSEEPNGWFQPHTVWLCLPDGSHPSDRNLTVHRPFLSAPIQGGIRQQRFGLGRHTWRSAISTLILP